MKNKLKFKCYRTYDGREFVDAKAAVECGINGYMVYENSRGREYTEYKVYALEVWGNERDGYEVNDRSCCAVIWLPLDASSSEIVKSLKSADLLKTRIHTKSIGIDGDEFNIHVEARRTGEPLYQMELACS